MASETSYSKNLGILYEIQRELAPFSKEECKINLAQMVVIGDQSTGKSALLTLLTHIPFPSKCGITTKRPIVAHTRHNKSLDKSKFFLVTSRNEKKEIETADVAKILSDGQDDVKGTTVTEEPVTIEVEGPDCENLTLVDLPGIIHDNAQTKTAVVSMIKKYIEPNQTLVLVVTEASKDDEMHTALTLARQFDPEGERTLRVLNKFDVFDSDESRKRAQDLVCKTQNEPLGCHAVVCRPDGKEYQAHEEEKHKWDGVPEHSFGIEALQKRLPVLLSDLIRKNLPTLRQQIRDVKQEKRRVLEKIGETPPSRTDCFNKIRAYLREIYERLRKMAQGPVRDMYESLQETKDFITMDKVEDKFYHDYFTPAVFQGIPTFKRLQKLQVYDSWQPIVNKLCADCKRVAEECIVADIAGANPAECAPAATAEASAGGSTVHRAIQLRRHFPTVSERV